MSKTISLVDLKAQYSTIQNEMNEAIQKVLNDAAFIQGEYVKKFEAEFASFCGQKRDGAASELYCASCANGTDAIFLAMKAIGIKSGDEVLVPSHTFIGSAEGVTLAGAKPIFVEIEEKTYLIDPSKIEEKITPKTKAIIAVHLYGQPCQMDLIRVVAEKYQLFVVEDAAQAHGAYWKNERTGALADIATFSFFPGKNLGAYGDAGALVSRNKELIDRARLFANHGRVEKYEHLFEGINSRLDSLQAAILSVKLKYLDSWTEKRNQIASQYINLLQNENLILPFVQPNAISAWHLFVCRSEKRDEIIKAMKREGISCGVHYPIPLHMQPAYRHFGYKPEDFPITKKISSEIISLPLFPELETSAVLRIADVLRATLRKGVAYFTC